MPRCAARLDQRIWRSDPATGGASSRRSRLEGSRGLTAVHRSLDEVIALWLAARLARESSLLPWSGAANSALAKLLASLPGQRATQLRAISRRVFAGPPASASLATSAGRSPPLLLNLFEQAFSSGTGLGFHYTDGQGRHSVHRIEPHGLRVEPPVW
jgi:predicted DNA-binding transcriptional regulator YafY